MKYPDGHAIRLSFCIVPWTNSPNTTSTKHSSIISTAKLYPKTVEEILFTNIEHFKSPIETYLDCSCHVDNEKASPFSEQI